MSTLRRRAGRVRVGLLGVIALLITAAVAASAPSAATATGDSTEATASSGTIRDRYIVVLRRGVDPAAFATARGLRAGATYTAALTGFATNMPARAAQALRRNPNVLLVEQDAVMSIAAPPSGIDRIDADENLTAAIDGNPATGNTDIDVAVLDTGVDPTHPDLNVAGGAGFAGFSLFGLFWVCDDGTASFADGNGHGTHVAGTIGARDDGPNVGGTDVVGVAPGARIHGVKVLTNGGSGAISCIIDGVDWVTQQKLAYQSSGGASGIDFEVANMSLGGGNSSALCSAVNASVAAGIVYAVAAGNSAQDAATSSPANCTSVLTMSAIADFDGQPGGLNDQTIAFSSCTETEDDSTACFTNDGSTVEAAAPGVSILSTVPGGYGTSSGTSMAAPHGAGAVALYRLAGNAIPDASGPAVLAQMTASGWTVPQTSACGFTGDTDGFAEPLIYVGSSCNGPPADVTDVAITDVSAPPSVTLGDTANVSVTVQNQGNQDVTGVDVSLTASNGAVSPSPQTVDLVAGQVTVLNFAWNTTGIAPGDQTLTASHDLADDDSSDDSASTTSTVVVAVIDAAITDVSAPASVAQNDEALVSVTVDNEGNQDVTGVNVSLTTTSGAIFGSPQSVDLLAGQSTVLNFTWDTTGAAEGLQTLTATHDLADDDPSDDSGSTTSTVVAVVTDLAITDVSAPASVIEGDGAAVSVTVENQGNQGVAGVDVSLATTGGSIIGSPQSVALVAGQSTVLNFTWDTTGAAAGVQTLTATHDLADDDPSDDSGSTTSMVVAAVTDLAITDVAAPASVVQGDAAFVTVTVVNEGNQGVTGVNVSLTTTGGSIIGSPQNIDLGVGGVALLVLTWDTTGSPLGVQTLTASHDLSDDDPFDDVASTTSTVTAPPSGIHVADLDASASSQGRDWSASVTIRIVDAGGNPVSGATVIGAWGSPVNSGDACFTGASGTCSVSASGIRKRDKSVVWTVTDVVHPTLAYDAGANTDPDGDSNGTTITVLKP